MRALSLFPLIFLLLAGCASSPAGEPPTAAASLFPDAHGLAYDAASDTLWVATHTGLQRRVGDGAWERVGPQQDLMGFSRDAAAADTFWASGHPPTGGNLGLIRSTDGGATWTAVGAAGADFHAMVVTRDAIYGSFRGAVHRSVDGGVAWQSVAALPVAAFAEADGMLFAATTQDVRVSADRGANWTTLAALPAYGLAAASKDVLYAAVRDGGVHKSVDGGRTWTATSLDVEGRQPGHVAIARGDASIVHVASYDGAVWRSDDAGATWRALG